MSWDSNYYRRKAAKAEAVAARPCPKCPDSLGDHRGYPVADCIVPGCGCVIDFAALQEAKR